MLEGSSTSGAESANDVLYRAALMTSRDWNKAGFVDDAVLDIVVVARIPLFTTAIFGLKSVNTSEYRHSCAQSINRVGAVLTSTPQVRIIHPSFADFLHYQKMPARGILHFSSRPKRRSRVKVLFYLNNTITRNVSGLACVRRSLLREAWTTLIFLNR